MNEAQKFDKEIYIKRLEKENILLKEKVKTLLLTENETITRMSQKIELLVASNKHLLQKLSFLQLTK